MKDLMKHLPLTLSVLTFLMIGSFWLGQSPKKGCQTCTSMRARISQAPERLKAWEGKGDKIRGRREKGKRGPKTEGK